MRTLKTYPEVRGTRAGYVIRYLCPSCRTENIIINRSAMDHFKIARVASCRHCRTRISVLTPNGNT